MKDLTLTDYSQLQVWTSLNYWTYLKGTDGSTMMMLQLWLFHLKGEFGSPLGNTFDVPENLERLIYCFVIHKSPRRIADANMLRKDGKCGTWLLLSKR